LIDGVFRVLTISVPTKKQQGTTMNESSKATDEISQLDLDMAEINEARGVTGLRQFNRGSHSSRDWKTATEAVANAINYMYWEFTSDRSTEGKAFGEIVAEFRKYFKRKASFKVLRAVWMITADSEWADMMEARRMQAPK